MGKPAIASAKVRDGAPRADNAAERARAAAGGTVSAEPAAHRGLRPRSGGQPIEPVEDSNALRHEVIATARAMNAAGINVNRSGNVSARCMRGARPGFVITPSGAAYDTLTADDLVFMRLDDGAASGRRAPSSEWRFHRDIYRTRGELNAIVHAHSTAATALACHGLGIPPFHYMVATAGGRDIRCAPYATFGTQELSDHVLAALQARKACLLAHHGLIACGTALRTALELAVEVEHLAATYLQARALGEPPHLDDAEMARVVAKISHYGANAESG
ncbi:MAG TPA: class II aldolase/adducin family protein [Burkholderiaceae bacterium]|nr:class II aldolase/adducin family protein [Burkholderiaceae bacterium]